jgi:hypothetical protein
MFDMVKSADKPLSPNRILQTARRYASEATVEQFQRAMEGTQRLSAAVHLPPVDACAKASMDVLPTFDLGFDIAASNAAGRVVGVKPDGPALQGGLRDGQLLMRTSHGNGQPDRPAPFTVGTDGASRVIEYYPRGAPKTAPQFHLDNAVIAVRLCGLWRQAVRLPPAAVLPHKLRRRRRLEGLCVRKDIRSGPPHSGGP